MLAAGVGGQSERLAGHKRKMAVESRVTQEEIKKEPEKPIDREKVWGPRRGGGGPGRVENEAWARKTAISVRGAARTRRGFFNLCLAPFFRFPSQTCPLLLRVFTTNNGRHHRMDEFSRGNVPSSELQIYTW